MAFTPRVIDISHHNKVKDFRQTAAAGVWGVIHKSSQGRGYRDPDYAARRKAAKAAGLLWGAYHFNDGAPVAVQVDWFLKCAAPDDDTLLVLDFEDNPKSNMTIQQAVAFMRLVEQKTGQKPAIYSGNRLKENIAKLSAADRSYLLGCRLWLCQYGPKAVLPKGFSSYWLWQYTGDGIGNLPHDVPGIVGTGIDLNVYGGTKAALAASWAPGSAPLSFISTDISAKSREAAEDTGSATDESGDADAELLSVQKRLKAMNYNPGIPTGIWGGMTAGAIAGFVNDRGGFVQAPTSADTFDDVSGAIQAEIEKAEAEDPPFVRPVTATRASGDAATVATVAPEVVPVKRSFLATAWASVAAFFAAIWDTISGYVSQAWDFFTDHKDDVPTDSGILQTAWGYVTSVPSSVWLTLAGCGLAFVAWDAWKGVKKITTSVQTGERQ